MRDFPGGGMELNYIGGNVVGLYDVVRITVFISPPTTDFNVEFATILLRTELIPGKKGQDRRRLKMRNVAHSKDVCPIPKAAGQLEFRGSPVPRPFCFCDAKVQSAALICPDIRGIELIS